MSNQAAVKLIAERLPAGLVHPGDPDTNQPAKLIPLPGLSNLGIPPAMAEHFAREAGHPANDAPLLIAEAIVSLLETDGGLELVDRTELDALRNQAATLDDVDAHAPTVTVSCHCNPANPILALAIGRRTVTTSGAIMRRRLDDVCSCT